MTREVNNWTRAFEPGRNVEDPPERPRIDLTEKQKGWLARAWMWASIKMLGFEEPAIPNAVPQYTEARGWFHKPAKNKNWHHIMPVGVANRMLEEPYNIPDNIVPVDESSHVGKRALKEQFIIHADTKGAIDSYGEYARNGRKGEGPFAKMSRERRDSTRRGDLYHDDRLDEHFRDIASEVTDKYQQAHPKDKWPKSSKKRGERTIQNVWNEETQRWEQIES